MKGLKIAGPKQGGKSTTMSMLKRIFWGLGAATLTYVVAPKMRNMAEPVVNKGMDNIKSMAEKGKQTIENYKSRYEDEANDMTIDTSLGQVKIHNDIISNKINALQEMVNKLQNEINQLKNGNI